MPNQPSRPKKKSPRTLADQAPEFRLESSGEFVVKHLTKPPKGPANKQIHPRRRLPLVPDAPSEDKK
jgi:hypothetical protein